MRKRLVRIFAYSFCIMWSISLICQQTFGQIFIERTYTDKSTQYRGNKKIDAIERRIAQEKAKLKGQQKVRKSKTRKVRRKKIAKKSSKLPVDTH